MYPHGVTGLAEDIATDDGAGEPVTVLITTEMVRIYKDLFGRGPARTRTSFPGPDILVCTLEGSFTPAERSLAEMGEHQRLRDARLF